MHPPTLFSLSLVLSHWYKSGKEQDCQVTIPDFEKICPPRELNHEHRTSL